MTLSTLHSPNHSHELMEGFIHVHGRVLCARLDICDLLREGKRAFRSGTFKTRINGKYQNVANNSHSALESFDSGVLSKHMVRTSAVTFRHTEKSTEMENRIEIRAIVLLSSC